MPSARPEHTRLKHLWKAIPDDNLPDRDLIDQIIILEICNWRLEESISALCEGIGKNKPAGLHVGHGNWHSQERESQLWAYYLACRHWLSGSESSPYRRLLSTCDAGSVVRDRVFAMLGARTDMKELYVERFCLCLEFWLGDLLQRDCAHKRANAAAVLAVEEEIRQRDDPAGLLKALAWQGDGKIQPCHHKVFRRYDIILSSIGSGKWRGAMPVRGTDGLGRADVVQRYVALIEEWIDGYKPRYVDEPDDLRRRIYSSLEERTPTRVFLASLLVSLLRSQQSAAKKLVQSRMKEPSK